MKAKIVLPIVLVAIVLFVLLKPAAEVAESPVVEAPVQTREAPLDEVVLPQDSPPEVPLGSPFVGLSEENAKERLRSSRNLIAADPSLSDEDRERHIAQLNTVYAGQFGEAPAMNAADLAEQERLRAVIENYKAELDQVKGDAGLSREQQKAEIRRIVREYMQQLEGN